MNIKYILISFFFCLAFAQQLENQAMDGVLAVVGENIVSQSEFFEQLKIVSERRGINPSSMPLQYERLAKQLLSNIIDQLVLLEHAKMDTNIFIGADEVKNQLNQQMNGFINNMGSVAALEKYLNKSRAQIEAFYWEEIYNAMLIDRFRYSLIGNISIGRKEVYNFYTIYKDSLPPVPKRSSFSILNLAISPGKKTIKSHYNMISLLLDSLSAELFSFEELVQKYSDDFASIPTGGFVGEIERGTFFKEYEEAAFSADIGEVVGPIKTSAGFHLIKVLDKRGEKITTQHLLKTIKPSLEDKDSVVSLINSLHLKAMADSSFLLNFLEGGVVGRFGFSGNYEDFYYKNETLPSEIVRMIDSSPEGYLSNPFGFTNQTLGILYIYKKQNEEVATLENSYKYISSLAREKKASEFLLDWLISAKKDVYINIFIEN